ncbi:MAG: TonB-dependent receptor, partial [Xenophilus sp.]
MALAVQLALGAALMSGPAAPAWAQAPGQAIAYDIPAGPLADALNRFALQSGVSIVIDAAQLRGLHTAGLQGSHGVEEGFGLLLKGSGYAIGKTSEGYVLRRVSAAGAASADTEATLPAVEVAAASETAAGPVDGYVAKRSATGTKTDTPIIETPQSVSVVTADRIEAIGAVNLKDVLAYTPGVGVAPYGTDSRFDWVSIRGFDAYSPGFYLDGLPMRNNGNFALWRTENYGAERIEVLRGPSSVLYGLGNPGGVVNVISKLPVEEPVHELQVQAGSHQRKQVAGDFSGSLNEDGTLLYRLTGLLRDAELPAGGMRDDHHFLASSLTWKPSADTRITVMSQFGKTRSGVYTRGVLAYGSLLPTAIGTRIPSDLFLGDPDYNRFNQDQQMVGYQFEHRVNDVWTLRQNARYSRVKVDTRQLVMSGFATLDADDALAPENYRYLEFTPYAVREKMSSFVIDNQAQANLKWGDWHHTLLFGLD